MMSPSFFAFLKTFFDNFLALKSKLSFFLNTLKLFSEDPEKSSLYPHTCLNKGSNKSTNCRFLLLVREFKACKLQMLYIFSLANDVQMHDWLYFLLQPPFSLLLHLYS